MASRLLLDHFKKFPVNGTGGLMLAKYDLNLLKYTRRLMFDSRDLKAYQDTISTFKIPALHERYEFIRQLGQIFLVQPDSLRSCISQGYLGKIEPALLKPYAEKRSDWSQCAKMFEDVGTSTTDEGRFRAFGSLMENFEGLKIGDGFASGFTSLSLR